MRRVYLDDSSKLSVDDDPNNILTHLLIYLAGNLINGEISFSDLISYFEPDGNGYSIPTLLYVYRIESAEDSPEGNLIDYSSQEYWNISLEGAHSKGDIEILGDELRRLFYEAYQIYVDRGLIKEE